MSTVQTFQRENTYFSLRVFEQGWHSHLFMFAVRCTADQQKKYVPVRAYFLMFSCLVFFALAVVTAVFALAVDMAVGFLGGGPILTEVRADFGCWLDFEEEAI